MLTWQTALGIMKSPQSQLASDAGTPLTLKPDEEFAVWRSSITDLAPQMFSDYSMKLETIGVTFPQSTWRLSDRHIDFPSQALDVFKVEEMYISQFVTDDDCPTIRRNGAGIEFALSVKIGDQSPTLNIPDFESMIS
jgi:hypothetical protein